MGERSAKKNEKSRPQDHKRKLEGRKTVNSQRRYYRVRVKKGSAVGKRESVGERLSGARERISQMR